MELRHIRYFLVLAEEMHFGRAAGRLHLSQPPLSRQIRILEHELGVELLARRGRTFALTEAGAYFKAEAGRILDGVEALERRTRLIGGARSSRIRIGYIGSLMLSFMPELLAYLKESLPGLRIDIVELATEEQEYAILSGRIDLGFVRSWAQVEGIVYEWLGEESLSAVYPAAFDFEEPPRSLGSFADLPFIGVSKASAPGLVDRIRKVCADAGFEPRADYECSQVSALLGLVSAGLGWSVIPAWALKSLTVENVRTLFLPDRIAFGIAYRDGGVSPGASTIAGLARRFLAGRDHDGSGPRKAGSDSPP